MISVILPTFNSENTIRRSIKSVENQKCGLDIELIIINDASTDNTKLILGDLVDKEHIKYSIIHNKLNRGVGYCRRIGIKRAKGRFIAFLDADDFWLKDKLDIQLRTLINNPEFQICFSNYLIEVNKKNYFLEKKRKVITLESNQFCNNIPMSTAILYSKIAKKIDYPLIKIRNDFIFWNKVFKLNSNIKAINCNDGMPLAVYGKNKGLSSNKFRLLIYQWNVYRIFFKYGIIKSFYGIFINICIAILKRIKFLIKKRKKTI